MTRVEKANGNSESDLLTSQLRDYTESTHRSQTGSHEPPRALSKSLPTRNTAAQSAPPNGKCRQSNGQSNKQAATSPVLKYMMAERFQIRSGRPGPNKHSIVGSNADRYNRPKPGLEVFILREGEQPLREKERLDSQVLMRRILLHHADVPTPGRCCGSQQGHKRRMLS